MALVVWRSSNAFHSVNEFTLHRAGLVLGLAGKPFQCEVSQLGQLSLLPSVGR